MKKLSLFVSLAAAAVVFTACGGGGGGGGYVPPGPGPGPGPGPAPIVWYLDDIDGVGVNGVSYSCDSGAGVTDIDGAFLYYPGDACTFDLWGFPGDFNFSLHIDDEYTTGVGGIPYDCASGLSGLTYNDGSFDYDPDDACTFYF